MSSKGRGSKIEPNELYETPVWCVHRLLDRIGSKLFKNIKPGHRPRLLEHAIGKGAIVQATAEWFRVGRIQRKIGAIQKPRWWGCDIAPGKIARSDVQWVCRGDFCDRRLDTWPNNLTAAITNPPFSIAFGMAKRALEIAPVVIQLSRIGWLGSDRRADWLRGHTPSVYLLPDRPSFVGQGRTDSDYYAWICWGLDRSPRFEVLDSTPLDVRKAEYVDAH